MPAGDVWGNAWGDSWGTSWRQAIAATARPGGDGTRRRKRHAEREELISWDLAESRQKRRLAAEAARLAVATKAAESAAAAHAKPAPATPAEAHGEALVLGSMEAYAERLRIALEADVAVRAMADALAAKRRERDLIVVTMMMGLAS